MAAADTVVRSEVGHAGADSAARRRSRRVPLVWLLWTVVLAMTVVNVILLARNDETAADFGAGGNQAGQVTAAIAYLAMATLGASIVARRVRDTLGWIFLISSLSVAFSGFASEYADFGLVTEPGSLPRPELVAWFGSWMWWAGAGSALTFALLLFPDGRLPSPRWRVAAWTAGSALASLVVLHAFAAGPLYGEFAVSRNPVGIDALSPALPAARDLGWVIFALPVTVATAGLITRSRRTSGAQRNQLLCVAAASAAAVLAVLVWGISRSDRSPSAPVQALVVGVIVAIPGAAAATMIQAASVQRLLTRSVLAREEERRRIQRDLHDGLGPTLAATALRLDVVRTMVRTDPDKTERLLGRLHEDMQGAIADVRRIIHDIRPLMLDQLGLVAAIEHRAASFGDGIDGVAAPAGMVVKVDAIGEFRSLAPAVEVAAYTIVAEALTNAARHGHASACSVELHVDGALEVTVTDDGQSLPSRIEPGVGLRSMCDRAAELGGRCEVVPGPGGGVVVRARLPLAGP